MTRNPLDAAQSLSRQAEEIENQNATIVEMEVFEEGEEMFSFVSLDTGDTLFTSFTDTESFTPERRLHLELLFTKAVMSGLGEYSLDKSVDFVAHAVAHYLDERVKELITNNAKA